MMAPRTDRPAQGRNTGIAQYRGGQLLSETQQTIVSEAGMNHNFENKKKKQKTRDYIDTRIIRKMYYKSYNT